MKSTHTSRDYEAELRELRGNLVAMAARCERALQQAVTMFINREPEQAGEVFKLDARIDRDEIEIDELALRILALRQPVAYDLRFLATTLKFVTDLERIGDKAVSIARRATELGRTAPVPPHPEIATLSSMALSMLREAMDAFVEGDAEKAEAVLVRDEAVNALYKKMSKEIIAWMGEHPSEMKTGQTVIGVARALERVADHATNLAEQVVFLVRGDDVRHRGPARTTDDGKDGSSK